MLRTRLRSRGGGGANSNAPSAGMMALTSSRMVDNQVSTASNVRTTHKVEYIAESANGPFFVKYINYRMSNVATEANGAEAFDLNAAVEYAGSMYDVTFNGAASVNVPAGGEVWGKIVGLNTIVAGNKIKFTQRRIGGSGSVNRLEGQEINARFQEGRFAGTSSAVDYTKNYGRGCTATGTITLGAIASVTFNNTSSNGLYEDGDSIIAQELQADGTMRVELIGTYTCVAGNPTTPTITTPGTGWVAPEFIVLNQVSSFGSVTGDVYGPIMMVGTATATDAKAMIMLNDSNGHSSADAAMHDNGFKGLYERGINGQHATFNASYSGRKASDVTAPATAFPKMIAAILPYYTHVLIALGGNDATTDTAPTIETNLNTQASYWRAQGKLVGYSTIPPRTTGTFLNDAGQTEATGFGAAGVVDTVNADIREARAVVSDFNIFDMREATESVTAVTKWRSDGGVAFTDGTHLTQLGVVVVGNHMANWPILLQAVSLRAEIASSRLQGSASGRSDVTNDNRTKLYMPGVAVSNIRLGYPGFTHIASSGGGEAALGNNYTLNTALENTAGTTFYKAKWRGVDLGTIPNNKFYISDAAETISTTANQQIFARSSLFLSASTDFFPRQNNAWTAGGGDFVSHAPSPAAGQAFASGAMTIPAGGTNTLRGQVPFLVLGEPATPIVSIAVIGDSKAVGEGDQSISTKGSNGWIRQALESVGGNNVPYTMLAVSASRAAYDTPALSPLKRQVLRYHTHVVIEYPSNDINAGTALATIQTYITNLCNEIKAINSPYGAPIKICVNKVTPRSSSTDSWATTVNQTVLANFGTGSLRDQYNQWLDTQAGTLFDYLFDPNLYCEADPVSGGANYGKFIVNGTANYATNDGVHLRSPAVDLIAPNFTTLVSTWTPT